MTVRLCWFVLTSYLSCDLFLYIGIKALFRAAQAVIILSLLLLCIVSRCDNKDFINTLYLFVMMICVQVFMLGLYELAAVHCEKAIKLHGIYTFIHCINTLTLNHAIIHDWFSCWRLQSLCHSKHHMNFFFCLWSEPRVGNRYFSLFLSVCLCLSSTEVIEGNVSVWCFCAMFRE